MGGQVPVRVDAAASFAALARDLRRAAAVELRRELYKGLQRAARPTLEAVRANTSQLPSGGGRGRRRTRMVDTGETLTNQVSGRTHKVRRKVKIGGALAAGESVAERVAGARFTVKALAGRDPRVRLQATESRGKRIDLASLDRGRLRHKTFGRGVSKTGKSLWFDQAVTPGWFTRPIEDRADDFAKELDAAVTRVADEINRG